MKLLVGYDGSEFADAAIDDLARAGMGAEGVEAVVLSVADVFPDLPASSYLGRDDAVARQAAIDSASPIVRRAYELASAALREADETAERGASRLRALLPRWTVSAMSFGDSPAGALIARAKALSVDLVVISSHGSAGAGRPSWGSVAQKVVTHAPCSVRVGRKGRRAVSGNVPPRLLLAVDGSEGSALAIQAVCSRRWPVGTEARVVAVVDVRVATALVFAASAPAGVWPTGSEATTEDWARHLAESAGRELREAGLSVSTQVTSGDPRAVLLDAAERWPADCVFTGAKGMSRVERFLLGSVSGALAARAPCSVEVVRAAES